MEEKSPVELVMAITRLVRPEAELFVSLGKERKIAKKKYLVVPNKMVEKAFFLKKGIIRHYIKNKNGEFTKNFIQAPNFVLPSLTDFFMDTPSTIYCETLTPIEVVEWERAQIFQFADAHTQMYRFLLRGVVRAFNEKEQKEIELNQMEAPERYHKFLKDYPDLINDVPLHYIASYLGIRPETLSRIRAMRIS